MGCAVEFYRLHQSYPLAQLLSLVTIICRLISKTLTPLSRVCFHCSAGWSQQPTKIYIQATQEHSHSSTWGILVLSQPWIPGAFQTIVQAAAEPPCSSGVTCETPHVNECGVLCLKMIPLLVSVPPGGSPEQNRKHPHSHQGWLTSMRPAQKRVGRRTLRPQATPSYWARDGMLTAWREVQAPDPG